MIPRVLAVAACVLLVAAPPILGAVIRFDGGSLTVFTVTPSLPVVAASVEIRPGTLARHDHRSRATVLIEAPDGAFDLREVVPASIRLCLDAPLCDTGVAGGRPSVGDADHDGIRDLEVTFPRAGILALVADIPAPADVTLVVSAILQGGKALSGTDTVRIVDQEPCPDGDGADPTDEADEAEPAESLEPPGSPGDETPSLPEPSIVPAPIPEGSAPPSAVPSPPDEQPVPTPEASGEPPTEPTPAPTPEPTPAPTLSPAPTPEPTPAPTPEPTPAPTPEPSRTPEPTPAPTTEPTPAPTPSPAPTPDSGAEPAGRRGALRDRRPGRLRAGDPGAGAAPRTAGRRRRRRPGTADRPVGARRGAR